MQILTARFIVAVLLFILMILSGIWMRRSGKPYNVIILNVHRLISLAALVMMVLLVIPYLSGSEMTPGLWTLLSITSLFTLTALLSGWFLNRDNDTTPYMLMLHKFTPYLVTGLTTLMLFLLIRVL
jgi:hypothetical protein